MVPSRIDSPDLLYYDEGAISLFVCIKVSSADTSDLREVPSRWTSSGQFTLPCGNGEMALTHPSRYYANPLPQLYYRVLSIFLLDSNYEPGRLIPRRWVRQWLVPMWLLKTDILSLGRRALALHRRIAGNEVMVTRISLYCSVFRGQGRPAL